MRMLPGGLLAHCKRTLKPGSKKPLEDEPGFRDLKWTSKIEIILTSKGATSGVYSMYLKGGISKYHHNFNKIAEIHQSSMQCYCRCFIYHW